MLIFFICFLLGKTIFDFVLIKTRGNSYERPSDTGDKGSNPSPGGKPPKDRPWLFGGTWPERKGPDNKIDYNELTTYRERRKKRPKGFTDPDAVEQEKINKKRKSDAEYKAHNQEHLKEYHHDYYEKNKERMRMDNCWHRASRKVCHPENEYEYHKKYREEHKEEIAARTKNWWAKYYSDPDNAAKKKIIK